MNNYEFYPSREPNSKDFLIRISIAIVIVLFAQSIYPFRFSSRNTDLLLEFIFLIGIILFILFEVFQKKFIKSIIIDLNKNKIRINYFKLLNTNAFKECDLIDLSFAYDSILSNRAVRYNILKLYHSNTLICEERENDYSFDKESLDLIVEKLRELKIKEKKGCS